MDVKVLISAPAFVDGLPECNYYIYKEHVFFKAEMEQGANAFI